MAHKPFPHPDGMASFWRSSPGELDDFRSTKDLPSAADIVIVGAGFSGGSLVTHLLASDNARGKSILVLEARELCSGATGRNGGHLKPDAYKMTSYIASRYGLKQAAEVADFELANVEAVTEYVKQSGADCDFFITRALDVQLNQQDNARLKAGYDGLSKAGLKATESVFYVDGKDAELVSGVKGAKGAFSYTAGHVWPYKMIHHMFSEAIAKGVNLQTKTPVTSISATQDADGYWVLETPRGTVRATQVVMTTNAYTPAILPEYENKIIPYRAVCCRIVAPGTPPLLNNTYSLRFNDWDFDYLIPRSDGSIVVGGARSTYLHQRKEWYGSVDDSKIIAQAREYFDGYMQRHFRGWETSGAKVDQVWTGIMGYSADRLPRLGSVPGRKNMYIMGGFTGHGMPQVFLAAKGLSQMVLGPSKYADTGLPSVFEETVERLQSTENFVADLYDRVGSYAKL